MKKFISLLFSIAYTITTMANVISTSLDSGTLVITCDGSMPDYSYGNAPWYSQRASVTKIIVKGTTNIGDYAFTGMYNATSVEIPTNVTSIGNSAFYQCSRLTSINIPASIETIGSYAFQECSELSSTMDLSNVKTLGQWVFHSCSKLTSVTLPSSLTYIPQCTFYGCSSLSSITIPSSVEYIGASAFIRCTSLTSITIPSSVKEIGDGAFRFTKLTNISIPTSVTYIENNAFADTPWFTNQPDGLIYLGSNAYTYKGTMAANTNLTLNSGTTSISSYAFYNCSGLLTITIPSTVTAIGNNAFAECIYEA